MSRSFVVAVLALGACGGPAASPAKIWTPREFVKAPPTADFGGWTPSELAVSEGQLIPFTTDVQGQGQGLPVRPGVSEGRSVAYVITDIWKDHPEPWLQPVWHLATQDTPPKRRPGTTSVFPVGLASTFYSPWWMQELVLVPDGVESLGNAREILAHRTVKTGSLILCSLIEPATISIASPDATTRHPLTRKRLWSPETEQGVVEGQPVHYLDFGPGRAGFDGQRLVEAELFVFVRGGTPVNVASVLPPDAAHHAFLRRVEVELPATAKVFVPSNRPDLRALVGELAGSAPPELDPFPEYALRVAKSDACFTAAAFPTSCEWLDSQAKVLAAVPASAFRRTTVQLVAPTLNEVMP